MVRVRGVWLLTLALAACEGPPERDRGFVMGDGLRGTADDPEAAPGPFGELEQAATVCGGGSTVRGIDVSTYQGNIDWARAAGDNVHYAFIRVSDGLNHPDDKFVRNWQGARANHVLRGAYQFFEPGQNAEQQADMVVQRIRDNGPMDLPPVIDVEATGGLGDAAVASAVGRWIHRIEGQLGVHPIIYTGKYFWQDNVGNSRAYNSYLLWHAQYTSANCPNIADAWAHWSFWQYTSSGRIAGISGNVDVDRFNGNQGALNQLGGGVAWAGQPIGQTFPLAAEDPIRLCVGETLRGTIRVRNTGTHAWDDTVRLAPTPRDHASALADPSWLSPTRVTGPDANTAAGAEGHFTFVIRGNRVGHFDQTFGLVAEHVTWFADAGGPRDDYLELVADVRDCNRPPAGALEGVTCDAISGWAADPDVASIDVRLDFDNGAQTAMAHADQHRDAACGDEAHCTHAFSAAPPAALRDGQTHDVRAYITDNAGGDPILLPGSPMTLNCEPSAADAGEMPPPPDAAPAEPDAAPPAPDAGDEPDATMHFFPDAAAPRTGEEPDGGLLHPPPGAQHLSVEQHGSGCNATDAAPALPLAFLALGFAFRRRQR